MTIFILSSITYQASGCSQIAGIFYARKYMGFCTPVPAVNAPAA